MAKQTDEFSEQYEFITNVIIDYGWIITPHMIGKDFQKVYNLSNKILQNPPANETDREKYQNEINELLTDIIFHPLTRAFFVHRAKEVRHVQNFSHHLERALLHYFKNDFFSVVLCLLPAIEGILLSYFGWQFGNARKPKIKDLIDEIEKCRIKTYDPVVYKLYAKTISIFLQKWIFTDTNTADTSLSFLNRHYVLHGMGASNYYSLSDANRLIMFFDLFIEFISIEQMVRYVFIPEENQSINTRFDYYHKLIEKDLKNSEILKTEELFMSENKNYFPEKNNPNWNQIMNRAVIEYMEIMKEIKKMRE